MDPFEARLQFNELLSKLTASQQTIARACTFAMRNKDLYENLYSCLIDEIVQSTINHRLNLFYLMDAICQASAKASFPEYIKLVRDDLDSIIEHVTGDNRGALNITSVLRVIRNWKAKKIFEEDLLQPLEAKLSEREQSLESTNGTLSKNEILKRIEEDRERHKKEKEESWLKYRRDGDRGEFDLVWDSIQTGHQ